MESPTRKVAYAPPLAATPTGVRGSMQRQASTQWNASIPSRAMQARAAVAQGHQTGTLAASSTASTSSGFPARRPLGSSQTMPVLLFSQPTRPSDLTPFQTASEIVDSVYRPNELQPFSETRGEGSSLSRASSLAAAADAAAGRSPFGTALAGQDSGVFSAPGAGKDDEEGDGFDLDDVLGEAGSNLNFSNLGPSSSSATGFFEDSQGSTRTLTNGLKRVLDTGDDGMGGEGGAAEDDDAMDATDVEDEGEEVGSMMAFSAAARPMAGLKKSAFSRTQSLPASAFKGMDF
ncbi:hypothetical protein JCM8547_006272 [Rhodosporidiobolus lusitaniae]